MTATPFVRPPWASPASLYRHQVELPTEEPLTLEEAKIYAGLDWPAGDPREALMRGFVSAARVKVELDTGLALLTQTWDLFVEAVEGVVLLPAQATPLQSITEVTALGAPLGPAVLTPADVTPAAGGQAIQLTAWPSAWGPFVVRVVSGWPTPAVLLAEAPLLRHAVGLLTAHYATLGRDLASTAPVTTVPLGYDEAIAPHRLLWLC